MHTSDFLRRKSFMLLVSLAAALAFVLAACGTNGGTGSGSAGGSTPTPTPTTIAGYGTSNGCPSDAVVTSPPSTANVTVKIQNMNSTINAHVGDVVEIDLPFGHTWNGPTTSEGVLALQPPAGYAWKTNSVCVWRFTAHSAGTTQLSFYGRALCKKGQLCPQFIMNVPFTITVK